MLIMAGFSSDEPVKFLGDNQLFAARDKLRSVDNVFGKYLTLECYGAVYSAPLRSQTEIRFDATRLRIAIAIFEKRVARLPNELNELVDAGILRALPNDSFDGKPFGYSAKDRMIWSAGENAVDKIDPPQWDLELGDLQLIWRIPPLQISY
jgi:hypothetical protein